MNLILGFELTTFLLIAQPLSYQIISVCHIHAMSIKHTLSFTLYFFGLLTFNTCLSVVLVNACTEVTVNTV